MIVKNEERTLPRLFASLAGQVDYYVISDTGSTDGTIEVLHQLGQRYGIPGEVHRHDWVNFAHNRNLALEAALEARSKGRHDCSRLMFMDADEEFEVFNAGWKEELKDGRSYSTYKQTEDWAMKYPFLIWIQGNEWTWKGEIHNYIVQVTGQKGFDFLESVAIRYHTFEGAKSHSFAGSAEKAVADVSAMLKELDGVEIVSANAFRFIQLAFAYRNAEEEEKAAEVMDRVVHCPGISKDRLYTALLFTANLFIRRGLYLEKAKTYLEQAVEIFPDRKEAYFYLSGWYRQHGEMALASNCMKKAYRVSIQDHGAFFLERNIYTWKTAYQLAFILYREGALDQASEVVDDLLRSRELPETEKGFVSQLKVRLDAGRMYLHGSSEKPT